MPYQMPSTGTFPGVHRAVMSGNRQCTSWYTRARCFPARELKLFGQTCKVSEARQKTQKLNGINNAAVQVDYFSRA